MKVYWFSNASLAVQSETDVSCDEMIVKPHEMLNIKVKLLKLLEIV